MRMIMIAIVIRQKGVKLLGKLELWFKLQVKLIFLMMDIGGENMAKKWLKEIQIQGI